LELIKDYDLEVHYHPGKANVVADALSQKAQCNCVTMDSKIATLCDELRKLNMEFPRYFGLYLSGANFTRADNHGAVW
jgi:hypothetical protein